MTNILCMSNYSVTSVQNIWECYLRGHIEDVKKFYSDFLTIYNQWQENELAWVGNIPCYYPIGQGLGFQYVYYF